MPYNRFTKAENEAPERVTTNKRIGRKTARIPSEDNISGAQFDRPSFWQMGEILEYVQ